MPLSVKEIENVKSGDKPIRLFDGGGLYPEVAPSGGKWWRFKYRFEAKEKRISFGVYPDIGLKDARDRRNEARKQLANGIDPGAQRKAERQTKALEGRNTFEVLAREWMATRGSKWTDSYASKTRSSLERHAFPAIGGQADNRNHCT